MWLKVRILQIIHKGETMEKKKSGKIFGLDRRFFSYYRPYMGLFLMDMFCAFLMAAISLAYPLIVRYITYHVLGVYEISEAMQIIMKLAALMFGLVLLEFGCNYFVTAKGHLMGTYMECDLREELFTHYQELSYSFYNNQKTGQLMSRLTNDLFNITELFHHGPEDIVISLIKLVGAFVILVNINVGLTLIVFAFIPVMLIYAIIFNQKLNKAYKKSRANLAGINESLEDNLSGIRVVKSFANEEEEIRKFKLSNRLYGKSKKMQYGYMGGFFAGMNALTTMVTIVVVVAGAAFIAWERINVADLLTYVLYINNFVDPVKKLMNFTEQFQDGATGYERFREIMDIPSEIKEKAEATELSDVRGDIAFDHVGFKYEDGTENVFSNISMKINAGSYVALVGTSGVGKTTMCNLIPRFFDVSDGCIRVDGQDVRDVTLKSLRDNIGMVQQDVYLFAGTVRDNIRYGRLNATEEEIIQAAKEANAHDFIMGLPDGYDTYIGQRGVKLSGGQKQRLSIARVFLKNPPILIFDEATSALDNESEKIVQESLEKLAKNRTTIVIAHRLSTIRNAERIVVLTENGIAEEGTHEALLAKGGIYANLYLMK